jgi:hypothetical protein
MDIRPKQGGSKSSSRNRTSGLGGARRTILATTPYKNLNENNLYQVGQSDPNKILPREFQRPKQQVMQVEEEVMKGTHERLAELTSLNSNIILIHIMSIDGLSNLLKKPQHIHRNAYVGYTKTRDD